MTNKLKNTHRPRYSVCSNRPHLQCKCCNRATIGPRCQRTEATCFTEVHTVVLRHLSNAVQHSNIVTAWRYASKAYVIVLCLSVCLSVCLSDRLLLLVDVLCFTLCLRFVILVTDTRRVKHCIMIIIIIKSATRTV